MTIYTVKRGDSLYRIAKRFGRDANILARVNGMERPETLSVGQTVVIPEPKSVYTVREGDTLYSLAQHFSTSVGTLMRNNPELHGTHELRVGDVLTIVRETPTFEREISTNTYVYPTVDFPTLRTMLPYLTYLTVMGYAVEADGTLSEPQGDGEIVELAREYGTAPIMQIAATGSNGGVSSTLAERVLSDEVAAEMLLQEIEGVLSEKRYRGVEIDFQGLPESIGEAYAGWLGELRRRLSPSGKTVFVSLTPQMADGSPDWYGGVQDFATLSQKVDGANFATYGWGYAHSQPMAVSPMPQLRKALDHATAGMVPDALTLGMSQYGYEWRKPFEEGKDKARPLDYATAMALAWKKRAAISYDEEQAAPYLRWFEREGGRTREHIAYFEDARSIAARLALIDEYGLDGITLWNGMQYLPQFWHVLSASYPIRKIWE